MGITFVHPLYSSFEAIAIVGGDLQITRPVTMSVYSRVPRRFVGTIVGFDSLSNVLPVGGGPGSRFPGLPHTILGNNVVPVDVHVFFVVRITTTVVGGPLALLVALLLSGMAVSLLLAYRVTPVNVQNGKI